MCFPGYALCEMRGVPQAIFTVYIERPILLAASQRMKRENGVRETCRESILLGVGISSFIEALGSRAAWLHVNN